MADVPSIGRFPLRINVKKDGANAYNGICETMFFEFTPSTGPDGTLIPMKLKDAAAKVRKFLIALHNAPGTGRVNSNLLFDEHYQDIGHMTAVWDTKLGDNWGATPSEHLERLTDENVVANIEGLKGCRFNEVALSVVVVDKPDGGVPGHRTPS